MLEVRQSTGPASRGAECGAVLARIAAAARMSGRVRLGDWTCPSGNNVEAFYRPLGEGLATLDMEWDEPPPLPAGDETCYLGVIRPALTRLVAEYTERTGCSVIVSA